MLRSRLARLIDPFTIGKFKFVHLCLFAQNIKNKQFLKFELSEMVDVRATWRRLKLSYASCLINRQAIIDLPRNRAIFENMFACYLRIHENGKWNFFHPKDNC
ncbi:hypothetical protein T4D_5160 [Trichinella pseudospiralis]|uniref:Uncharacterized protein n=1 Tax=Trichinella pseudospiralis TaxID=6337 RepID=A0A0V1FY56_TRIPS|nr:hypothetical protein T4D_5160 [Trichinella pseudospiralis]